MKLCCAPTDMILSEFLFLIYFYVLHSISIYDLFDANRLSMHYLHAALQSRHWRQSEAEGERGRGALVMCHVTREHAGGHRMESLLSDMRRYSDG